MRRLARFAGAERVRPLILSQREADAVRLLPDPASYYAFLREQIRLAKTSITLSALYLGSGALEMALVGDLRAALLSSPSLNATVILDHSRAQRSSASLAELVDEFGPERFKLLLYQMPQLRGLPSKWLPSQLCEVLGVYHCKFSLFDGSVLLTGANLSEEYFVDRQDRYLFFPRQADTDNTGRASVASFLLAFANTVEPHCHRVLSGSKIRLPDEGTATSSSETALRKLRVELESLVLEKETGLPSSAAASPGAAGAVLLPLLQHAPAGLRLESSLLPRLLHAFAPDCQRAAAASPYPTFPPPLASALIAALGPCKGSVLVASLSSHGFARGTGFKALLPAMHLRTVNSALATGPGSAPSSVKVLHFSRPGWTFHAKGFWLWLAPSSSHGQTQQAEPSVVSYVGSSNLGRRSWGRDLELGFVLSTGPGRLAQSLTREYEALDGHAKLEAGPGPGMTGALGVVVSLLARALRGFM